MEGELLNTATNFDSSIKQLGKQESESKDYLRDLVKVFDGVFRGDTNKHMRLFYILVPALSINFVESMRSAKDRVLKKRQIGTYFSDDGFGLGLAYILKVLNQKKRFKSLNWFESVNKKLLEDQQNIKDSREGEKELEVDKEISLKNVKASSEEYNLLYYSFSASQIFFNEA